MNLLKVCRETLKHLQENGLAKLNKITGNTSTVAYMLEQAIAEAEKLNTMGLYVLVKWPESQKFMEHDEFIPAGNFSGDDGLSSAGFIPLTIYEENS